MSKRKHLLRIPNLKLLLFAAIGAVTVFIFQDCANQGVLFTGNHDQVAPSQGAPSVPPSQASGGNGGGYNGKLGKYIDPAMNGECGADDVYRSVIENKAGVLSVTRENCKDIQPRRITASEADILPHNSSFAIYGGKLYQWVDVNVTNANLRTVFQTQVFCRARSAQELSLEILDADVRFDSAKTETTLFFTIGTYGQQMSFLNEERWAAYATLVRRGQVSTYTADMGPNSTEEIRLSVDDSVPGSLPGNIHYRLVRRNATSATTSDGPTKCARY